MTTNRTRAEIVFELISGATAPDADQCVREIEQALNEAVRDVERKFLSKGGTFDKIVNDARAEGTLAGLEMVERECNDKLCHCTMVVERLRARAKELEGK